MNVSRVDLGLNLSLGLNFELGKKWLEQRWDGYNKSVEDEGEKELARTRQPTRPGPAIPKH